MTYVHSNIVAWTTCSYEQTPADCISELANVTYYNASLQLHVSSGFVDASYNLVNESIEFVSYTAPPIPYSYIPSDIFDVLKAGFGFVNASNTTTNLVSSNILNSFSVEIQDNSQLGVPSGVELQMARNILTIPLITMNAFNFPPYGFFRPVDSEITGYLAKSHYRVVISNY